MKQTEKTKSELAVYISECVKLLEPKPIATIASEAGFAFRETLQLLMDGKIKLPLDRVAQRAEALNTDADHLRDLAYSEWFSSGMIHGKSSRLAAAEGKDRIAFHLRKKERKIVNDTRLPWDGEITENERAWIEFLRIICNDEVPAPASEPITALRELLDCGRRT